MFILFLSPAVGRAESRVVLQVGVPAIELAITLSDRLPPILKSCLFGEDDPAPAVISQREFTKRCVAPYIHGLWLDPEVMLRTHQDIARQARDELIVHPEGAPFPLYYPPVIGEQVRLRLKKPLSSAPRVVAKPLPAPLPPPSLSKDSLYNSIGLLFLPNAYVVPGDTFNEMYGWDSFFIIKGMLASIDAILRTPKVRVWSNADSAFRTLVDDPNSGNDRRAYARRLFDVAKGMVDNHVFQIEFYGGYILNANRTYYLTRSQPPLFTQEALAVLESAHRHGFAYVETLSPYFDESRRNFEPPKTWEQWILTEVLPAAKSYYAYWTDPRRIRPGSPSNPRVTSVMFEGRANDVYLYGTDGIGPVPEVARSTQPQNRKLYETAARGFAERPHLNPAHRFFNSQSVCAGDQPVGGCGDATYGLTQAFYAGDRAVRASGFDLSGRFGPYGEWTLNYAPIALNVLLLQMAEDIDTMAALVGEDPPHGERALAERRRFLERYFARPPAGYGDRLTAGMAPDGVPAFAYPYGTQFYLLWADVLREGKARRDLVAALGDFLGGGRDDRFGIPSSLVHTGMQWDSPYAWAPIQYFAVDGLMQSGFHADAAHVMRDWISAVDIFFADTGTLIEKYDATNPADDPRVAIGYAQTQRGFGWTNAVYLMFANRLYERL